MAEPDEVREPVALTAAETQASDAAAPAAAVSGPA